MNNPPPEHDELLIQAYDLARQGATRGMVLKSIRNELADPDAAEQITARAFSALAGKRRMVGLLQMILGAFVILAGVVVLQNGAGVLRKTVLAAGVAGLIILIAGGHNLWHSSSIRKSGL